MLEAYEGNIDQQEETLEQAILEVLRMDMEHLYLKHLFGLK